MSKTEPASWDMVQHLTNKSMCDAFLAVARDSYPDLLLRVRESIARAMSGWLVQDGYRAEVRWSGTQDSFVGHVRLVDEDGLFFQGRTPAEVHNAFLSAVRSLTGGAVSLEVVTETPAQLDEVGVIALPAPAATAPKQRKRVRKSAEAREAEVPQPRRARSKGLKVLVAGGPGTPIERG